MLYNYNIHYENWSGDSENRSLLLYFNILKAPKYLYYYFLFNGEAVHYLSTKKCWFCITGNKIHNNAILIYIMYYNIIMHTHAQNIFNVNNLSTTY